MTRKIMSIQPTQPDLPAHRLTLLEEVRAALAALPSTATRADTATVLAALGSVCITQSGSRGDRAYFDGGGIGAGRFGRGAEQGNAAKARKLVAQAPDADICVVNGNAAVIFESETGKVRPARQIQHFR